MKTLKVSLLVMALLSMGSCAIIQKLTCNANNAKSQGAGDATNGNVNQPGLQSGNSCEGDYTASQYQADYRQGYEEKKAQICQGTEVVKIATSGVEANMSKVDIEKKIAACQGLSSYKSLKATLDRTYTDCFCSSTRAQKIGEKHGDALAEKTFEQQFVGCEARWGTLKSLYESSYAKAEVAALKRKQDQFVQSTGTSAFAIDQKNFTAVCSIPADQSHVRITVNNPNPSQTLVQGQWNYQYFDKNFAKIADDSGVDAVLLTPKSNKSFTKMTLPRNASFCRAEFAGQTGTTTIK